MGIAIDRLRTPCLSWKEKHLDYEIETDRIPIQAALHQTLEKKSISITRLKQVNLALKRKSDIAWKEKHLDYEIETML